MCTIRPATEADNGQLLELTRQTPMPGTIGLRIDREPDFFRLLALRGEGYVYVAETGGRLLGCIAVSRRQVRAAGDTRTLWYVGDLKVHPDHRGRGIAAEVVREAFDFIVSEGVDLLLCVVSAGNRRVVSFLEGRYQIPPFQRVASLKVLQVLASRTRATGPYRVREARPEDAPALAALHRESARGYELAPEISARDWQELSETNPAVCRVLVAEEAGTVQAAACLFDGQWAKQHVVVSMPRSLSLAAGLLRPLGAISPAFRLPRKGETISMLFLRHLAAREGHTAGLRALVQASRRHAHGLGYPVVVYGLHGRDPHWAAFRGLPRFAMGSELYLTSVQGNPHLVREVARGVPFEDYAVA